MCSTVMHSIIIITIMHYIISLSLLHTLPDFKTISLLELFFLLKIENGKMKYFTSSALFPPHAYKLIILNYFSCFVHTARFQVKMLMTWKI